MSPVWGEKRKANPPDSQPTEDVAKPHESIGEKIKDEFKAAAESLGDAIGEAKFGGN